MTYATDHSHFADLTHPVDPSPPKQGLLRRIFDTFMQSRQRQAEHEIVRFLAASGGRLTDSVERSMMQHLLRSSFGNRG